LSLGGGAERSLFKKRVQIASAVDHAENLDAGAVGQFVVEYEVVGEFRDDPGADVLVTVELPPSA
jgi:hypothetical protein